MASHFLELDMYAWSELLKRFVEPAGCHKQTHPKLELESVGSWIGPQATSYLHVVQ